MKYMRLWGNEKFFFFFKGEKGLSLILHTVPFQKLASGLGELLIFIRGLAQQTPKWAEWGRKTGGQFLRKGGHAFSC